MDKFPDELESGNAEAERDVDGKGLAVGVTASSVGGSGARARLDLFGERHFLVKVVFQQRREIGGQQRVTESGIVGTEVTVVAVVVVVVAVVVVVVRVIVIRVQIEVKQAVRIVIDANVTAVVVFLGDVAYGGNGVGKNCHATD